MYEDMIIQELSEDQLDQIVGGGHGKKQGGPSVSFTNNVTASSANISFNANTNTASSASLSAATGGSASAVTSPISITLITI